MKLIRKIYHIVLKAPNNILALLLLTLLVFTEASGQTKTFAGTGNFSDGTKWGGSVPAVGNNLVITGTCTFDNAAANLAYGTLVIGSAGTAGTLNWQVAAGTDSLNVTSVSSLAAGGNLDMSNGGTLIMRGAWTSTNLTFTHGTGTIDLRFGMTLPTAYPTYSNLSINAAVYCSLAVATTVTGNVTIGYATIAARLYARGFDLTVGGNFTKAGNSFYMHEMTNNSVTFNGSGTQYFNGNSGQQQFYNVIVNKPPGSLLQSTTGALQMNSFTLLSGDFIAPTTAMYINWAADASLYLSAGTTFTVAASCSIALNGNMTIESGATFTPGTGSMNFNTFLTNNSLINGTASSVTFYNLTVSNGAGNTLSTAGSITTINVTNNYVNDDGAFTTPAAFNVTGNITLTLTGILTAGANISVGGNWSLNSTNTFTPGSGTVTFNGTAAQSIMGSAVAQTFNHIIITKTAATLLNTAGSTVTLNARNFIITTGDFTAPTTMNVTGNWSQAGATTFTPGTRIVNLTGTTQQSIGGSTFYNVTMTNTAGAALTANVGITNVFNLSTGGSLSLVTSNLTMGTTASITTYSAARYIITNNDPLSGGFLIQRVSGTKVFPVGTTTYTPATVTNSGVADDFRVRVFNGLHTGGTSGDLAWRGVNRTWLVEEVIPLGSVVNLTLTWNIGEEIGSFARANCRIVHFTGETWDDTASFGPSTGTYSRIRYGIRSFSPFGVTDTLVPLPVELLSFTAKAKNKEVELNWITATEINNSHFDIERSSDGRNFEMIGRSEGAGNSNRIVSYQFTDNDPLRAGISYYRLKQQDFDGTTSYSAVQAIRSNENSIVPGDIYPMPAQGSVSIPFHHANNGNCVAEIYDMSGKILFRQEHSIPAGSQVLALPTSELKPGVYIISLKNDQEQHSLKLIK